MATPSHQNPGHLRPLVTYPFRLGPPDKHLAWNGFGGLAAVNNLSSAGDALVAVALAGIASGCLAGFGALVYKLLGSDTALALASLIFAAAALAVDLLPRNSPSQAPDGPTRSSGRRTKPPPAVVQAGVAMAGLRP